MTPAKVMKEWTLTKSNGDWTCDTADEDDLDDLLFVLEKIGVISGSDSSSSPSPTPATSADMQSRLAARLETASRSSPCTSAVIQEMLRSRTGTTSSAAITKPSGVELPEGYTSTKTADVAADRQNWEERVSHYTAGKTSPPTSGSIAQAVQDSVSRAESIAQARSDIISQARSER